MGTSPGKSKAATARQNGIATSPSGNRTPVSRVTGGDTHHYTNEERAASLSPGGGPEGGNRLREMAAARTPSGSRPCCRARAGTKGDPTEVSWLPAARDPCVCIPLSSKTRFAGRSGNTERNAVPRSRKLDGGRHGRTARASWAGASPRPARAQGQASRHLHAENPRQVRCYHVAAARHESLIPLLVSIVVSIPACHAGDRGSIPRRGGGVGAFFSLETGRWNPPPTCFSLSGPHPQRSSCWETRQSVQSWEQREGIGGCLRSGRPAAS
ncbi:uncharacterized protein LOC125321328 isoform X1 [Corvus hawaiiensis]|uniref:uncharacterized protein LOC125321328 isoform X1 n=1 Tax=Corvus hawaiiensis TaxID=134902 RepID=UPI0020189099|nr:uncharacterized protein LOC125321328 isoform X1 [Corvus hawaiiensis]